MLNSDMISLDLPKTVMIFAAGKGTRMGELTKTTPKPLIQVAGKPLIDHALTIINKSTIQNIVVNTHYLSGQIEQHLADSSIKISHERTALFETGGGLKNALPLIEGPSVITLNSDIIWNGPNPIEALLQSWDPQKMDALLMLVPPHNAMGHKGLGDFTLTPDARIERGQGFVYSGCQIMKTHVVAQMHEDTFSLNLVWDKLIATNCAFGMVYDGKWCDVGHPEGITLANAMLEKNDV